MVGAPFTQDVIERAADALHTDYTPLTDLRGTADYRLDAAANLLRRMWHAAQGESVSVLQVEAAYG